MTKAKRILDLYDGARTTREIADIVGCGPEYVRVVARQRKGSGMSLIDLRYMAKPGVRERKTARDALNRRAKAQAEAHP